MIGVFDSGLGGLTVLRTLARRFPHERFVYLGDHANVPYGDRSAQDVLDLTQRSVNALFAAGARLVLLGCNTATAVAARHLQQKWLPQTPWRALGHNVLGIVAPTVEAATQTPWAVTVPQYPQKYNRETIVVFATTRTSASNVYAEEIGKRCPKVRVIQITCSNLAGAIEARAQAGVCREIIARACAEAIAAGDGVTPERAILGCTHFPIVEHLFRQQLPAQTRLLSQPNIVADSLEDYLARHPQYTRGTGGPADKPLARVRLTTTGDPADVAKRARIFWPDAPAFTPATTGDDRDRQGSTAFNA